YQKVRTDFNYPLFYYVLGGLILVVIVLLLIFGKRILKWIKLRRLRIQYEQFSNSFNEYVLQLKVNPAPELAEKTLILWKNYQERLEGFPFSVLTTKEILTENFTHELRDPLKSIDRVVYGKRVQEDVYQEFHQIENFTQDRYARKMEEIKNGK
ncbi:MAG: hypothetical protein AAFY41_10715, partial [Bacteroidota bacterium]